MSIAAASTVDSGPPGGLCRDCLAPVATGEERDRCRRCSSPRLLRHPELDALTLAHIDCDAFYASIEKRDNPALADKPVIVGGGRRGVVSTACYIARKSGVHSAMPMFKALKLCPQAVVIHPDMAKYAEASGAVRAIFAAATPLVEPLSLDEAYLDLTGTQAVHGRSAAAVLAEIALRVEREIGITVSIGLSWSKFLAKLASEMDKPRGFGVIGRAEATALLGPRSVRAIPGIGPKLELRLAADGFRTIADLQGADKHALRACYGAIGESLAERAFGRDGRRVEPDHDAKGISAETTFEVDLEGFEPIAAELWPLCETVARRLKRAGLAGRVVVLKLRRADFRRITRRAALQEPTQLAERIWERARALLAEAVGTTRFRLVGVGVSELTEARGADPPDLFARTTERRAVEAAIDAVRAKFGAEAIGRGRGFRSRPKSPRAKTLR
jgi:DNA polymerase-4